MSYHTTIFSPRVSPQGLGADATFPLGTYSELTKSLQKDLNSSLSKLGCRSIGTDGKLGPETCGALSYVIANPSALSATAAGWSGQVMASCKSYNYTCKSSTPPVTAPPPVSMMPPEATSSGSKLSTANMVVGGTVILAVGILGYAIAKKKGMIK